MLISPLNAFPWVLNGLVEAWVSLKRVQKYLLLPEIDPLSYYLTEGGIYQDPPSISEQNYEVISITNGSFSWRNEEEEREREREENVVEWLLKNMDISIRKVR